MKGLSGSSNSRGAVETKPVRPAGRRLGVSAVRIAARLGAKGGHAHPELFRRWSEILGPALARDAAPGELKGRPGARTLTIRAVNGVAAARIQHQTSEILKKVNGFLGARGVQHLHIDQSGVSADADLWGAPGADAPGERSKGAPRKRAGAASADLEKINDADLRAALERLAARTS